MIKNEEVGVLSSTVLLILTVLASAGHLLGGPAFGDHLALAMTSAKHQMWIAMLIAVINVLGAGTIYVIVIYLISTNVATIPYTKWCKKQLVTQVKP
jgi:hypothetical protein